MNYCFKKLHIYKKYFSCQVKVLTVLKKTFAQPLTLAGLMKNLVKVMVLRLGVCVVCLPQGMESY